MGPGRPCAWGSTPATANGSGRRWAAPPTSSRPRRWRWSTVTSGQPVTPPRSPAFPRPLENDGDHDRMEMKIEDNPISMTQNRPSNAPRTAYRKIWEAHTVSGDPDSRALIYVDLHLVHEVTSPQAFSQLRALGRRVRRPDLTLAVMDHAVPTWERSRPTTDPVAAEQLRQLADNCAATGIPLLDRQHRRQGIVHVIGPELGLSQPGMTIVCGDSHTSTHGAFGALAFGIGTSEVE